MIQLSRDLERLVERMAEAEGVSIDEALRRAIEGRAAVSGLAQAPAKRKRMTVEEMTRFGERIAALPLIDPRSPQEIVDDINAL